MSGILDPRILPLRSSGWRWLKSFCCGIKWHPPERWGWGSWTVGCICYKKEFPNFIEFSFIPRFKGNSRNKFWESRFCRYQIDLCHMCYLTSNVSCCHLMSYDAYYFKNWHFEENKKFQKRKCAYFSTKLIWKGVLSTF